MPGIALVRHVSAPLAPREWLRAEAPPHVEAEHVEEVWDAELVGDPGVPGWIAEPAHTSYRRAGVAAVAPLVDLRA